MFSRKGIFGLLAIIVVALSLPASSALASTGVPIPGTVTANANATMTDLAVKRVNEKGSLIVYDEHIKVNRQSAGGSKWFATCTNSSYVVGSYHGSSIVGYPDSHCLLQRDSHSPTGWVKRGGGKTGRDCKNIAAPPNVHVPFPVFHGTIVSYASKALVKIRVHARAAIHTVLDLWCGHFEGSAVAQDDIWVRLTSYIKLKSRSAKMNFFAKFFASAADSVSQNVSLNCSYTPPSTTPPPTPTPTPTPKPNHPPSGQLLPPLHIIVDDTQPVCVDKVSDPDGDQVSLNFVFKDTNGNVVGQKVGDVWIQPMGARCQNFKAPGTPQQVTVYVTLTDNATARGAASNASVTLSDNIPITPDQF
jgi:hypothetical protein